MKTEYQVIARYEGQKNSYIAYETKNLEEAVSYGKKIHTRYPNIKIKVIKLTEETVKYVR